jgi:hypothetical protein
VAAAAATPIAASLAGPPFLVSVRAVTTTMAAADHGKGPYCISAAMAEASVTTV